MIKPVKDSDKCGLHQLPENFEGTFSDHGKHHHHHSSCNDHKFVSLFEQKRLKGWWPCIVELPDNRREIAVIKKLWFNLIRFIHIKVYTVRV